MVVKTKLYISILLLITVLAIGIIGFVIISNETLVDSIYMTIITMSTVGFGTLHELNQNEKIFTIILIILSIAVYGYSVTALTEYLAKDNFFQLLKYKKMQQKIQKLKNHTVVCGYGRNGRQAVVKLKKFNMPYVVIEKDKELLEELDRNNILYIEGDATGDEALEKAALENAKSLITALPSDADNLFVVLSARQINKDFTIISRASNESSCSKLMIAGATNIIMPDKIGGEHMASLVVTPDLVEFVEKLTITDECSTNLEEISINDLPSEFLDKTILDLDVRRKSGCTVIGFKTPQNEYIINPEATTKLKANSNLIVLGRPNQIEKLRQVL
ncbi:potassium transporter TrkA [Lutibacter profundi]|uniref:Potassium transporter TrkA n=1 Tax=Lutibacter profundi TaxID=1622118 RepID=A0A109RPF7_9FLAO|nr:potassium channel protein [Lutibacter profundi]AMC10542.1 potassium transporter TrkA [Lutibacter profundi]